MKQTLAIYNKSRGLCIEIIMRDDFDIKSLSKSEMDLIKKLESKFMSKLSELKLIEQRGNNQSWVNFHRS